MASRNFSLDDSEEQDRAAGAKGTLRLRAANSAGRTVDTLSPWVQELLSGETSSRSHGALVRRLMRTRGQDSVSFNGTLALLKRFHRIVTRSVAWQVNVGSIDPNLFERFSIEMSQNREIGANNIGELLKLNRQDEALPMPLAGIPEGQSSRPAQQSEAPKVTFEELRRRVEEARMFRSQSAGAEPDFVVAKKKEDDAAPSSPTAPGRPPQAAPRPMPNQPAPPPSASAPASPDPAALPPRLRRRRFARKVEYLSMPESEDEDEGGTGNDDEPHPDPFAMGPSPPDFLDAGEAAGPTLSTLLPFAPFAEESAPDTPGPRRDQPARRPRIVRALRRAHDDVETPSRPVPVPRRAPQLRPGPAGPRSSSRLGMIVKRGAPVVRRSFDRLAQSVSGNLLASRPQQLLGFLHSQSSAPRARPVQDSPATAGLSLPFARASDQETEAGEPGTGSVRLPTSTPVALEDFALPPLRRQFGLSQGERPGAPDASGREEGTGRRTPLPPGRVQAAPLAAPVSAPGASRQAAGMGSGVAAGGPSRSPVVRETALAQLQARVLRPLPTLLHRAVPPERGRAPLPPPVVQAGEPASPAARVRAPVLPDAALPSPAAIAPAHEDGGGTPPPAAVSPAREDLGVPPASGSASRRTPLGQPLRPRGNVPALPLPGLQAEGTPGAWQPAPVIEPSDPRVALSVASPPSLPSVLRRTGPVRGVLARRSAEQPAEPGEAGSGPWPVLAPSRRRPLWQRGAPAADPDTAGAAAPMIRPVRIDAPAHRRSDGPVQPASIPQTGRRAGGGAGVPGLATVLRRQTVHHGQAAGRVGRAPGLATVLRRQPDPRGGGASGSNLYRGAERPSFAPVSDLWRPALLQGEPSWTSPTAPAAAAAGLL